MPVVPVKRKQENMIKRQRFGSRWGMAAILLLLAGCAATSGTTNETQTPSPVLQQVASRLPGRYISIHGDNAPAQLLIIERREDSQADGLALSLTQSDADGGNIRRYGLRLESGALENRLAGEFALLADDEQVRRSCSMAFHLTGQGLVGETDPASCRFGEGENVVGLLKEIAFDGRGVLIGDQLVDPQSGMARGDDQIIHFLPVVGYEGWLGIRQGEQWHVARGFSLRMGMITEPLDAAQMSLGVSIELDYYRMQRNGKQNLMRLTVTDAESGQLIAEAWAEPGSQSIGIALPELQVGLSRAR